MVASDRRFVAVVEWAAGHEDSADIDEDHIVGSPIRMANGILAEVDGGLEPGDHVKELVVGVVDIQFGNARNKVAGADGQLGQRIQRPLNALLDPRLGAALAHQIPAGDLPVGPVGVQGDD